MFLAVAIGAVGAVAGSVGFIDPARGLAPRAAPGEPPPGRGGAGPRAPDGGRIELVVRGDEVVVEVTAPPVPPLPLRVGGRAVAVLEPGVVP
ncbi:MAG: hypothetical protein L0I24_26260 [Pseudonocardia sp.]|nr:hypothetical protein [Pseudonocardia sp.]